MTTWLVPETQLLLVQTTVIAWLELETQLRSHTVITMQLLDKQQFKSSMQTAISLMLHGQKNAQKNIINVQVKAP